jgi:adenine-specific DNA-methyltransferase
MPSRASIPCSRTGIGASGLEPHLVDHLVSWLREFGLHLASDRIRDAAAGGAAFLMPLARMRVEAWKAEKASGAEIIRKSRS